MKGMNLMLKQTKTYLFRMQFSKHLNLLALDCLNSRKLSLRLGATKFRPLKMLLCKKGNLISSSLNFRRFTPKYLIWEMIRSVKTLSNSANWECSSKWVHNLRTLMAWCSLKRWGRMICWASNFTQTLSLTSNQWRWGRKCEIS